MTYPQIAVFTDSYLPTINGVTYTVRNWRDRWLERGGRMAVVFPNAPGYDPRVGEHAVRSLPFPWYDGYRLGWPRVPASHDLSRADVVHTHTPFGLGLAAQRLARRADVPLVASYHTPTAEYARYLLPSDRLRSVEGLARRGALAYERRFYDRADVVLAPSETTRRYVRESVGISTPVRVVPMGVDLERFEPVDTAAFRERHGLERDAPLIGYTGRHGHEKRLEDLLDAVAGAADRTDTPLESATFVLAGDGPARPSLERRAAALDFDVRFLGFLDRDELPALYSALDVFAFPSPVETQGLVALEAIACGTPVVGVDAGALAETVSAGETGYHYPVGDLAAFRRALERALDERSKLASQCLERRESVGLERSVDRLRDAYASVSGR
ncbi:glycosyltransferase family 4 protein [Natronorubrum sp. DTA28]|uniref:glycosyltransferase family 4 protein n=1 Tax=Natronorubrum sp. DTA28 TaxID=3447019 RepID=UPI003F873D5F